MWGTLFLFSGVVNFNDPDPLIWVSLYWTGAGACAAHAFGRLRPRTSWTLALLYLLLGLWVARHGIEQSHLMKGFPQFGLLREEIVRETLGLWLVAGWALAMGAQAYQPADAP